MIVPIRHISDTALWVAMCRAIESEREDALFHDPYACLLAGERGAQIIESLPQGGAMTWPVVVRTAVIDEIMMQRLMPNVSTVMNLGAGVDARVFRLPVPATLSWFDIDLPEMIAYRQKCLGGTRPACMYQSLATDLTDPQALSAVLARANEQTGHTVVITEGLLSYLSEKQVSILARQIHAIPRIRWWLTDLVSVQLLQMLRPNWHAHLSAANAPMQFAPEAGAAFFTSFGWQSRENRSIWEESLRWKRCILPSIGLSDKIQKIYRNMSSVVLLERVPETDTF